MLLWTAVVLPCHAAELLLPGPQAADPVRAASGDVWMGLWADHLAPVTLQVLPLDEGRISVEAPGAPLALLRGISFPAGKLVTYATGVSLNTPIKVGELSLERKGTTVLVSDGDRRQMVEVDEGTRLLWAGDLDQDGHTDLVFGGGTMPASLWLSSGSPYLLRQVAGFSDAGC
jgi:hypothetical protein